MIREEITSPWPSYVREMIDANPPLPHAEQLALCRRWQQQDDEQARNRLASSSLRFIASIALAYRGRGLELTDLIQEGTLGCLEAIDRFDESRGFRFITYAVWWIRQTIQSALADQAATIRMPQSRVQANAKAIELRGALEQQLARPVSLREGAAAARQQAQETGLQYPGDDQGLGDRYYSLDAPIAEGDGNGLRAEYFAELASEEDSGLALEERELHELTRALLPGFTDRERRILGQYYGLDGAEPMTLEQIGQELGITRERVRQVKDKALAQLKRKINGHREEYHTLLAD